MDTPKFGLGDMVWHRTCGDDAGVIIALIYRQFEIVLAINRTAGRVSA